MSLQCNYHFDVYNIKNLTRCELYEFVDEIIDFKSI